VAKLKDTSSASKTTTSANTSTSNLNKSQQASSPADLQQTQQQVAPQPPAGYIQNLITKILFNICIIVNNVVVKFVEDDMVLSVNMKSAECFSVNHLWEKSYMDIGNLPQQQQTQPQLQPIEFKLQNGEHHVRKILQLNDVTICLDKLDSKSSSKIDFYQDPLIYRCSIQSRLDFKFNSNLNLNNIDQQLKLIKLNFYCRKFEMSITDRQLPLVIRLVELILAIVDDTLELPSESNSDSVNNLEEETAMNKSNQTVAGQINPSLSQNPTILIGEPAIGTEGFILNEANQMLQQQQEDQGWLSWAWSYVPSVSDLIPVGGESGTEQPQNKEEPTPIQTIIGFYFDEFNMAFKLTKQQLVNNSHGHHHQQQQMTTSMKAYSFEPFVLCNMKGIAFEVSSKENFSHMLIGVSYANLRSVNECSCKLCPKPADNEIVIKLIFYGFNFTCFDSILNLTTKKRKSAFL
jgi:vacuolar protein sorting-associated protein 13B